jgi:hypothetical protein
LDFIYFLNEQDEDAPYEIGQLVNFSQDNSNNTLQLQIRRLKHYDDFAARHGLNSFTQANSKKNEVCDNNFYYYFTYNALLASSLLHITNRNYPC